MSFFIVNPFPTRESSHSLIVVVYQLPVESLSTNLQPSIELKQTFLLFSQSFATETRGHLHPILPVTSHQEKSS